VEHPNKQRFPIEVISDESTCFIGLSETIKENYSPQWFRKIVGNRNFVWQHIPPNIRFGGIFLGIDIDLHKVLDVELEKHFVRMFLLDKNSKIKWHLIYVYGVAQHEEKDHFLVKFAQVYNKCKGGVPTGGKSSEKNKPCILPRWSLVFFFC
jgi:hypothetical protein